MKQQRFPTVARRNDMTFKNVFSALLVCAILGGPLCAAAVAGSYNTIESSPPQEIMNGMGNKAARGIANVTTGWLEFPKQIYTTSSEEGAVKGIFIGPFKGIGMMLIRTVTGAAELATFFVAYPGFYAPYFDPAYVWQKE
jgi:putative exosortase-associated protein (TIGR04073 family)